MTPTSSGPVGGVLAGRICIVTGAAAGIGRAIARLFARAGAVLVVADRDAEGLASLDAALVAESWPAPVRIVVDATDPDAPARILAPALARGGPDVLSTTSAPIPYARCSTPPTRPGTLRSRST